MKTHYETLGVLPVAKPEEIKAKYMVLAKMLHPDTGQQPDSTKFAAVTEAYSVLKDKEKRRGYDLLLKVTTVACTTCQGRGEVYEMIGFTRRIASYCPDCKGTGYVQR